LQGLRKQSRHLQGDCLFLNAACIDHPNPARRLKGTHFPRFSLASSYPARTGVALQGILADEGAID
jgi:hypothetical protein